MSQNKESNEERKEIYKILKAIKKGDTFVDDDGYKCHVLANLKKDEQVVFKYFGINKKWWHYNIESYFWFELRMRVGENNLNTGGRKPIKITKVVKNVSSTKKIKS